MKTYTTCRICQSPLEPIYSLGDHYISDFLLPDQKCGIKAPMELMLCSCCCLLQLKHTVPAETLYRNYWYRSSTNESMQYVLADIAQKAETYIQLQEGDAVLDIGCNDGTLLASYKTKGICKIGFDPAKNLAVLAQKVANHVVSDFFSSETFFSYPELATRPPKIITSIAMFYDLDTPKKFVSDIKKVMHPDGLWIVQMSYLPLMIQQNAFDNICHEHLTYYSLYAFEYLLNLYDLEVVDMELNYVNGGSFRLYIRNRSASKKTFDTLNQDLRSERLHKFRAQELDMGLDSKTLYTEFAMRIDRIKNDVVSFILQQTKQNKKFYVYGASTKGNTLLQHFGLNHTLITAAADRNPNKWGKVTVGTRIPIVSEQEARAANPDYFLILPWHFLNEFKIREKEFLLSGGRFLVPLPHFSIV